MVTIHLEHDNLNQELLNTLEDIQLNRNLYGPFNTVEEAMESMLENEQNQHGVNPVANIHKSQTTNP